MGTTLPIVSPLVLGFQALRKFIHSCWPLLPDKSPRKRQTELINLPILIAQVAASFEDRASRTGVQIDWEIPPDAILLGTKRGLRSVLTALFGQMLAQPQSGGRLNISGVVCDGEIRLSFSRSAQALSAGKSTSEPASPAFDSKPLETILRAHRGHLDISKLRTNRPIFLIRLPAG